jgi:formate hydrogenlyase subunit 3/multisubunit Na+/H+ antiporter MnhD subunit
MSVGSITILGAVLMALIQHDFRKMLAFHAVSQVGYMVLGIGTGVPVGVMGGVFHMLNHAIYKCCLFLCGGSVQRQTGRTKFSELGGLAGAMPWTFMACLVAALAISGVPPMNGFASKWLVYQGVIEGGGVFFPIFLTVAMFGSALTLASFMKLLYSMFWGDRPKGLENVSEAPHTMTIPMIVLALFCLAFGIFYRWPVDNLIKPILGSAGLQAEVPGLWQSELAAVLLIVSLLIGLIIYWAGRPRRSVEVDVFLGGEAFDPEIYRVPGTHFYGPIKGMNGLRQAYAMADRGSFDLYWIFTRAIVSASYWIYQYIDQSLAQFYQEVIPAFLSLVGQLLRVFNAKMVLTRVLWVLYAIGIIAVLFMPNQYELITLTRIVACIGMIGWAFLAWVEWNLTRMLILAATSQFGFVVLGASLSSGVAISYLLSGSVAIAVLFIVAFYIRNKLHTDKIDQMNGVAGKMPWAFILFVLAALWLSGLPPFGSFFSKFLLGVAASEISPFLTIAITGGAILTLSYLLRPIGKFLRAG